MTQTDSKEKSIQSPFASRSSSSKHSFGASLYHQPPPHASQHLILARDRKANFPEHLNYLDLIVLSKSYEREIFESVMSVLNPNSTPNDLQIYGQNMFVHIQTYVFIYTLTKSNEKGISSNNKPPTLMVNIRFPFKRGKNKYGLSYLNICLCTCVSSA